MNYFDVALVFFIAGAFVGACMAARIAAFCLKYSIKDGQLIKTDKWDKTP